MAVMEHGEFDLLTGTGSTAATEGAAIRFSEGDHLLEANVSVGAGGGPVFAVLYVYFANHRVPLDSGWIRGGTRSLADGDFLSFLGDIEMGVDPRVIVFARNDTSITQSIFFDAVTAKSETEEKVEDD